MMIYICSYGIRNIFGPMQSYGLDQSNNKLWSVINVKLTKVNLIWLIK